MANRIPSKVVLTPDNTQIIKAVNLYYLDPADDSLAPHYFDNTAVVKATLLDPYGSPVAGCNALALTYVTGSQGSFAASVQATFAPGVGTGYTLFISADQGALHGEWNIDCEVALRTS